jgi:hypothetical protein
MLAKEGSGRIITRASTAGDHGQRGRFLGYATIQKSAVEWSRPHRTGSPLDILKGKSMMLRVAT